MGWPRNRRSADTGPFERPRRRGAKEQRPASAPYRGTARSTASFAQGSSSRRPRFAVSLEAATLTHARRYRVVSTILPYAAGCAKPTGQSCRGQRGQNGRRSDSRALCDTAIGALAADALGICGMEKPSLSRGGQERINALPRPPTSHRGRRTLAGHGRQGLRRAAEPSWPARSPDDRVY